MTLQKYFHRPSGVSRSVKTLAACKRERRRRRRSRSHFWWQHMEGHLEGHRR